MSRPRQESPRADDCAPCDYRRRAHLRTSRRRGAAGPALARAAAARRRVVRGDRGRRRQSRRRWRSHVDDRARPRVRRVCDRRGKAPQPRATPGSRPREARLVAFIDDDCEPAPGWLAALLDAARQLPGVRSGRHRRQSAAEQPVCRDEPAHRLVPLRLLQPTSRPGGSSPATTSRSRGGCCGAGGFDATLHARRRRGSRAVRSLGRAGRPARGRARGRRPARASPRRWRTFVRQHFDYGRGAWGFRRARAARAGAPLRIEPWTFYRDLLLYPVRTHGWRGVHAVGPGRAGADGQRRWAFSSRPPARDWLDLCARAVIVLRWTSFSSGATRSPAATAARAGAGRVAAVMSGCQSGEPAKPAVAAHRRRPEGLDARALAARAAPAPRRPPPS